jgi:hypothetical protein
MLGHLASILARAKTFQAEALLITIGCTHAEPKIIDLCLTKWGIDIVSSSLGLLSGIFQIPSVNHQLDIRAPTTGLG